MNSKAVVMAADELMNAMRKPDGTYRTYEEMVAEGIPTKYETQYNNPEDMTLKYLDPIPASAIRLPLSPTLCIWRK